MGIIQLPQPIAVNTGVIPNIKTMCTTDNLATITAAGYLNYSNLQGYPVSTNDVLHIIYSYNTVTKVGTFGIFTVSISNGVITLTEDTTTGEVTYTAPSIANHMAVFTNTTGNISQDASTAINAGNVQAGISGTAGAFVAYPTTAAKGQFIFQAGDQAGNTASYLNNAAFGQATVITIPDPGATTANVLLNKSAGTQTISSGNLAVGAGTFTASGNITASAGNLVAGASGAAGTVSSFPATAANGSLILAAANAGGAFNTTISNGTMGQSSVYTIPDIGAATGQFAAFATAGLPTITGQLILSGGTTGKVAAGPQLFAKQTAVYAGGGTSNAFVATGLSGTSIVTASIASQTNAASIVKVVPSLDTLTITFSADPGANTTIYYIATATATA